MRYKVLLSVLIVGASVTGMIVNSLAVTYQYPVDEVLASPQEFEGRRIIVQGNAIRGSILQKKGTNLYLFDVGRTPMADQSLRVSYAGVVPDTFKDDAEVTVTGRLQPDGTFVGTHLLAKCPSKYEARAKEAGTYGAPTFSDFDELTSSSPGPR